MHDFSKCLLIELNKNYLKALASNGETSIIEFDKNIVTDTKIVLLDEFTSKLKELIKGLKEKPQKVVFLVEEKDFYDRFFVVRGDDKNAAGSLREQASAFLLPPARRPLPTPAFKH